MHAIENLIIKGRLDQALEKMLGFADNHYRNSIILQMGRYNSLMSEINMGVVDSGFANTQKNQIRGAIQSIFNDMREEGLIPDMPVSGIANAEKDSDLGPAGKTVFISYNHGDKEVAQQAHEKLKASDIQVVIDSREMAPGTNITDFIKSSIQGSDVTLSIISNNSLMSSWVGLESIYSFYNEELGTDKKFIACFIEDDFFKDDFRIRVTRKIDGEIQKMNQLIDEHQQLNIDHRDLVGKLNRFHDLRHNLGTILERLRNSLCIDIREANFEAGMERVISTIKGT